MLLLSTPLQQSLIYLVPQTPNTNLRNPSLFHIHDQRGIVYTNDEFLQTLRSQPFTGIAIEHPQTDQGVQVHFVIGQETELTMTTLVPCRCMVETTPLRPSESAEQLQSTVHRGDALEESNDEPPTRIERLALEQQEEFKRAREEKAEDAQLREEEGIEQQAQ